MDSLFFSIQVSECINRFYLATRYFLLQLEAVADTRPDEKGSKSNREDRCFSWQRLLLGKAFIPLFDIVEPSIPRLFPVFLVKSGLNNDPVRQQEKNGKNDRIVDQGNDGAEDYIEDRRMGDDVDTQ